MYKGSDMVELDCKEVSLYLQPLHVNFMICFSIEVFSIDSPVA